MNRELFVKLLQQRQFKAVRSILDVMNEVDIASLLSELDDRELALSMTASWLSPSASSRRIRQRKYFPTWRLPCRHTLWRSFRRKS